MCLAMGAEKPQALGRRSALLIEHVAALDQEGSRPSALERLERMVGGELARFLVDALGDRPRRVEPSRSP